MSAAAGASLSDSRLNILLLGAGGREHAIAAKLAESNLVNVIYIVPGPLLYTVLAFLRCVYAFKFYARKATAALLPARSARTWICRPQTLRRSLLLLLQMLSTWSFQGQSSL